MDILTDEHEREEAVKKWWHEHWKPITLGIVIALAGLVGVRQYQAYQLEQDQKVALEVYHIQTSLEKKGVAALDDAQKFLDAHKDIFGSLVALDMASLQLKASKFDEAEKLLTFAKTNGGDLIAPQAALVTARVQAQTGKFDDALKTLDAIKAPAYKAEISETKGDILLAKGDRNGAHDAYLDAINATKDAKLQISNMLQIKFDNVIQEGDKAAYKIVAEQSAQLNAIPVSQ